MASTKMQIQCQNCRAGNLPGSPYCSRCGAPLGGADNPSGRSNHGFTSSVAPVDPVERFGTDGQDRSLVKQTYSRASGLLTQGEQIEYIAVARGGLAHAPDCAVATNKRVMLFKKKVLGKVELDDCWWRDVGAASLVDARNGVTLKLDAIQGWHMAIENLPKAQASHVYDIACRYGDRLQGSAHTASHEAATPPQASPVVAATPHPGTLPTLAGNPSSGGLSPLRAISNAASSGEAHVVQAATPVPVPSNYIPTPESVLQSILQSSALEDGGVPTRPMQWSAAAFQAPAVADVQPIVLAENGDGNGTDTEPQMRPLPPLTTLERIAIFTAPSGPLALDATPSPSTPLHSSPLPQSGPLQPTPSFNDNASESIGGLSGTGMLAMHTPLREDAPVEAGASAEATVMPRLVMPTGPINVSAPLAPLEASGPLYADESHASQASPVDVDANLSGPAEHAAPGQPVDEAAVIQADVTVAAAQSDDTDGGFSNVHPTAPMGFKDYLLPVPGSISSGPLLAASTHMDAHLEELYRNTNALATQRLDYEAQPDPGDIDTRINLALHNTPTNQAPPPARNSGGLGRGAASSSQSASGELKGGRGGGSRGTSGSRSKSGADDPIAKMKQLKAMLDAGLITEEDYTSKKADILARI
ncbi:MAG: SHOCT domain-containing protein [Chloroflexia bacterium]